MFNEANTVENYIIELLSGQPPAATGPPPAIDYTHIGRGKIVGQT